jgi:hypothetical protein
MKPDHYAFREIDHAVALTKSILFPFDIGIWIRLAIIAFFAGGVAGGLQLSTGSFSPGELGDGEFIRSLIPQSTEAFTSAMLYIAGILICIVLIYFLLNGIFQFILIRALGTENIHIRTYFRESTWPGTRYFAFLFFLTLIFFGICLAFAYLLFAPLIGIACNDAAIAGRMLILVILMCILLIPYLIILMLTTDFVVPIMSVDRCGVIAGWRRCLQLFHAEKTEAALYTVMKLILSVCVSIFLFFVLLLVGIGAGIPLMGILIAAGGPQNLPILVLALLFAGYCAIVVFCGLMTSVPFMTFLRVYSLYVVGDFDERYVLLRDLSSPDTGEGTEKA